jgi:bacteriorhodopsin
MGNQALSVNPSGSGTIFNLTTNGSNWLWSVFSVMSSSAILISLLSMRLHPQERTLYLFNISILTTASIAYFCMASDLGFAPVEVLQRGPGARQYWYVRYIDWVITTPLLIAELLLTAGLPINIILSTIFADIVMIICGLIGGLVPSVYKWAFYVFGCVAMFWIFWNILSGIKSSEKVGGTKNRRIYIILTSWILFFWSIYPIAWGLCEGANVISVTGEMIFYGILDILTKPGFAILTLFLHRNLDIKKEHRETDIHTERYNYPQSKEQRQEPEYPTGYAMGSSNVIRSQY